MSKSNSSGTAIAKDPAIITGHIFFGALIVLSLIFSRERILFADCAFHLYQFINEKWFQIFNLRFIAVLSQLAPLGGVRWVWPLETLVKTYSLSFSILYYIYFILAAHVVRDKTVAIAIILFHALFTLHTFFWIQSEFPQGLMLLFLAYALLRKRGAFWNGLFLLFLIPVIFSHPLMLFPVIFIMMLEMAHAKNFGNSFHWVIILFVIALFILKSYLPSTGYESGRISFRKLWRHLPGFFQSDTTRIFIRWLLRDYFMLLAGLLLAAAFYLKNGFYAKCALILTFFTGHVLLVNLSYPDIRSDRLQFYFENLYLPLGVFVSLPLASDIIAGRHLFAWKRLVVAATCAVKIFLIVLISENYTARLDYLKSMIHAVEKFSEKKFIIPTAALDMDVIRLEWALPCETILHSSLRNKSDAVTIISSSDPPEAMEKGRGNILEPFGIIPQGALDTSYFNITGENYRILSEADLSRVP